MKKILKVVSSVSGAASKSTQLADGIIAQLQERYPGSTVTVKDLAKDPLGHFDASHLLAFRGAGDATAEAAAIADKLSEAAIREVEEADIIILGVALYNFHIPSTLKAWLDHVVRAGRTFSYVTGKPEGLLKDKKVYIALASGGVYSEGPAAAFDFASPYLLGMLGFIGLTDVQLVRAEGCSIPGLQETAVQKGLEQVVIA
jgi:FMN-dependent NADH-azoreductase